MRISQQNDSPDPLIVPLISMWSTETSQYQNGILGIPRNVNIDANANCHSVSQRVENKIQSNIRQLSIELEYGESLGKQSPVNIDANANCQSVSQRVENKVKWNVGSLSVKLEYGESLGKQSPVNRDANANCQSVSQRVVNNIYRSYRLQSDNCDR